MSENHPSPDSEEPTAATIAAGKKTPATATPPPAKPPLKKVEPAPAKPAAPAPVPVPKPDAATFSAYTRAMKEALGYRE